MQSIRKMDLTEDLVSLCHRDETELPLDPSLEIMTDDDFRDMAQRLAGENQDEDLWVFAYGSLIWKPEFETLERRRATAFGWHRAFTIQLESWRGTPQQPGLMMALERGGRCDGVIYRLPRENHVVQIERLLRREVSYRQNGDSIRWLPTMTADGPIKSLGFWVGPTGDRILPRQPLENVAAILARACGHIGSGAEYLYKTVLHLEEFGIHDRNLWKLQKLVAQEIRALHRT